MSAQSHYENTFSHDTRSKVNGSARYSSIST
ncbi:MAG: hypothetical protein ACJA13_003975, partial [Paraglaciecola sp.]